MVEYSPGLSGVTAFTTNISEPDREGGTLRYRGIDVDELAHKVGFEAVWSLLVTGTFDFEWELDEHQRLTALTGDVRVDLQAGLARLGSLLELRPVVDLPQENVLHDLARVSQHLLSFVAQAARGSNAPVSPGRIAEGRTVVERFMIEWQGTPDQRHVEAVEDYWITAAEHGANASTFTSRVIASTGADVAAAMSGAVGALSGPLHGGAPSRALEMVDQVMRTGDANRLVKEVLDRGERLMGFGHPVYHVEDPRARIMRATAQRLGAPKYEAALAVEKAALSQLGERKPGRVLSTNVDFWAAVVLDFADIPHDLMTPLFACARTAGWSAHILEQCEAAKIFRPSARYEGPVSVRPETLRGWNAVTHV